MESTTAAATTDASTSAAASTDTTAATTGAATTGVAPMAGESSLIQKLRGEVAELLHLPSEILAKIETVARAHFESESAS